MDFGFVLHPLCVQQLRLTRLLTSDGGLRLTLEEFSRVLASREPKAAPFVELKDIASLKGNSCRCLLVQVPLLPDQILDDQGKAFELILQAGEIIREWGGEIVGLGALTAVVGARGEALREHLSIAVTTGNSYTVWAAVRLLDKVLDEIPLGLDEKRAVVIGFPGSIATGTANLLAKNGWDLTLVSRRPPASCAKKVEEIRSRFGVDVELTNDLCEALRRSPLILTATSSGGIIKQESLPAGAVVIDIAMPRDVTGDRPRREDVLILDGGLVDMPPVPHGNNGNLVTCGVFSCFAETAVLALENRRECYSIGRDLSLEKITAIGELADQHGFSVGEFRSFGEPLDAKTLLRLKKSRLRLHSDNGCWDRLLDERRNTRRSVKSAYRDFVNPSAVSMTEMLEMDRCYRRARGMEIFDADGKRYLDFLGGYGAVNLGHNHPACVSAVRDFLDAAKPSILQTFGTEYPARLAELLALVSPGDLQLCFFCNSGAEANEGAIKLARFATGRTKIAYAENSFHGKTLGALSITGNERYQRHFRPLLPGCVRFPYGDEAELEKVLSAGDVAAVFLEPIQAEGGVIVPPAGFLKEAARLCRKHGTLLVLDEVQTGLGRTGRMFAAEHDGIQPDIMTLAKSLGGGMLPLGAYLTARETWERAYGRSIDSFMLHSSTFGGGNLACCVGLAAVRAIIQEKLPDNAARVGAYLVDGLREVQRSNPLIRDVRGRGLLIGVEFESITSDNVAKGATGNLGKMIEEARRFFRVLPAEIHWFVGKVYEEVSRTLRPFSQGLLCGLVASRLLNRFGIVTHLTLNHTCVLRVEPPLVISKSEAEYFINALRSVCDDLASALYS